jgi:hypothetical protein
MTETLHPQVSLLAGVYRRDLRHTTPSDALDARIGRLVAGGHAVRAPREPARRGARPVWGAAAGLGALAVTAGVLIGMRFGPATGPVQIAATPTSPPADFSMWPTDSVALQFPAEYSRGKLVALDSGVHAAGKRYWVNVVVSNDGTVRIEQIVPADPKSSSRASQDGITLQKP